MMSRAEVTTRSAKAFKAADKRTKGRILDEVTSVTGWSRDNARRRLTGAAQRPPGAGRQVASGPAIRGATAAAGLCGRRYAGLHGRSDAGPGGVQPPRLRLLLCRRWVPSRESARLPRGRRRSGRQLRRCGTARVPPAQSTSGRPGS